MRISGQGLGPGFTTVATRRSVIFRSEGREFVLTPLGYASILLSASREVPRRAADDFRISRRPSIWRWFLMIFVSTETAYRRPRYRDCRAQTSFAFDKLLFI